MSLIERRLDRIERMLERMLAPADVLPNVAATAVNTLDDIAADLETRGIDVDERLHSAARLVERLTEPTAVTAIHKLLRLVQAAPDLVATLADTVDEVIARAHERGVDLDDRMRAVARLLEQMTQPDVLEAARELFSHIDQMTALASSGMLDPQTVETLGIIASAVRDTMHEEPRAVGLFGSLAALRRRRVKPAVGFAVSIAERFGDALLRRNGRDVSRQLTEHRD